MRERGSAVVEFALIDPERDPVNLELEFEAPPGSGARAMTLVGDPDLLALVVKPQAAGG